MRRMVAADRLAEARARYEKTGTDHQRARDILAAEVRHAAANGMPEAQIARHAGVTRQTVRAWIKEAK